MIKRCSFIIFCDILYHEHESQSIVSFLHQAAVASPVPECGKPRLSIAAIRWKNLVRAASKHVSTVWQRIASNHPTPTAQRRCGPPPSGKLDIFSVKSIIDNGRLPSAH